MNVSAMVYRRAAEIVERGWCQGEIAKRADGTPLPACRSAEWHKWVERVPWDEWVEWREWAVRHPEAGQWCAAGARVLACLELNVSPDIGVGVHYDIDGFNDAPGRTASEVAAMFREAADIADRNSWMAVFRDHEPPNWPRQE